MHGRRQQDGTALNTGVMNTLSTSGMGTAEAEPHIEIEIQIEILEILLVDRKLFAPRVPTAPLWRALWRHPPNSF